MLKIVPKWTPIVLFFVHPSVQLSIDEYGLMMLM
jgi:hypothetical protein